MTCTLISTKKMAFQKLQHVVWQDSEYETLRWCTHSQYDVVQFLSDVVSILQSSSEGSWSSCVRTGTGGVAMDIKFI